MSQPKEAPAFRRGEHVTHLRVLLAAAAFGIAGAASGYCEEAHPFSWYAAHPDEITSRIRWCRAHPDNNDMGCVNAMIACASTATLDQPVPACAAIPATEGK